MSVKDTEAELDDMWVQIHSKQDSIPSILAGHLTEESKAALLAWRDRCVAEAARAARIDELQRLYNPNDGIMGSHYIYIIDNAADAISLELRKRLAELAPTEPKHE